MSSKFGRSVWPIALVVLMSLIVLVPAASAQDLVAQAARRDGGLVWVWVAFSALALGVLGAGVASNRQPRKPPAAPTRVPDL
jgi:hypothetical protein